MLSGCPESSCSNIQRNRQAHRGRLVILSYDPCFLIADKLSDPRICCGEELLDYRSACVSASCDPPTIATPRKYSLGERKATVSAAVPLHG